jgi:hypothetical protein
LAGLPDTTGMQEQEASAQARARRRHGFRIRRICNVGEQI